MNICRIWAWLAIMAMVAFGPASLALGTTIPVTGWDVHNGTSTVTNGGTNSPTFSPADDNITVMGTFPEVELANDGDSMTVTTTLALDTRTGSTGINALNTQLRIGLFDGPAGAIVADDIPNLGFIMEYSNATGLLRAQGDAAQTNPFNSPTADIGTGSASGGSIQGADVGPVDFALTLTRNAGMIEVTGQISGTDSVALTPFVANYSAAAYDPGAIGFAFNRVGFSFRGNVNSPNGTLNDVTVTTNVPEPTSLLLVVGALVGGALATRRFHPVPRA